MSSLRSAFSNGKAFIPFITCGDPSLDITEKLVYAMEEAGADLIELGIPFSDPTAEGETIQKANERALLREVTTDKIFGMVATIRLTSDIPLAFMTYANVVFSYGTEKFLLKCQQLGIGGLILPDIPFEEKDEFEDLCEKYQVDLVSLIAPTSKQRIEMIASAAHGFLYCVSSLGVTGTRTSINANVEEMVQLAKSASDIPCAVGFGISNTEQAKAMAKFADGVIVGSAIVKMCEAYKEDCVEPIAQFVREMKAAIS